MATPATAHALVERTDIHKSCKSLEIILNILNEYCEAVGAIVTLQKKLAKALREAAGLKATGEIASNAFNGSAAVFEALLEVDTKYTKFADKEYDSISTEVKKWFKKLVKEEKAHDQKLEKANARIKQAGQSYEKKSKKNPSDAAEEHARYINLISTLGPEISQEKYNHALNVTQKHNITTYSVASCFARIADAEWLKACEGVRLLAPTIGILTQWRVLCEGGWTEEMPQGLPNDPSPNASIQSKADSTPTNKSSPQLSNSELPPSQAQGIKASPEQKREPLSRREASPVIHRQPGFSPRDSPQMPTQDLSLSNDPAPERSRESLPPPSAFDTLKPPFFDPATGSVRTLSAFPAPPTHFPLPPVRQQTQVSLLSHSERSSASNDTPAVVPFTESPLSTSQELKPFNDKNIVAPAPPYHNPPASDTSSPKQRYQDYSRDSFDTLSTPPLDARRPLPVRTGTSSRPILDTDPLEEIETIDHDRRDQQRQFLDSQVPDGEQDSEFGVQRNTGQSSKAQSYDALRTRNVERTDTGASSGSIVAAMRNRYSSNPGSSSPPPRELPRIPLSVTDLAARYQVNDSPTSSRPRPVSPPVSRQLSFPMDRQERMTHRPNSNSVSTSTPTIEEDTRRRKRDFSESGFRERERELQERERELEARARELERDRARLMTVHEGDATPSVQSSEGDSHRPPISPLRPRRISLRKQLQRPPSQVELDASESPRQRSQPSNQFASSPAGNQARSGPQQSLALQSPSRSAYDDDYRDHRSSEERRPSSSSNSPHAPYCGCHTCSASKYASSSSSEARDNASQLPRSGGGNALRPPISPDKPKGGWMRRLSMPGVVSSAFNMDSKRHSGLNYGLGSGVSSTSLASAQKKGLLSFDGRKNSSASNLLRPPEQGRVQEDGRLGARRSFDGNRSATNLGQR